MALDLPLLGALLAAGLFTALAAMQLASTSTRRNAFGSRPARLFSLSAVASAAWGWATVLQAGVNAAPALLVDALDLARYAGWFAFLSSLLPTNGMRAGRGGVAWLRPVAVALVIAAALGLLLAHAPAEAAAPASRITLAFRLALSMLGLILVEQLFANAVEDARWSAKPLCLALAVIFATDFYLYAQGLLFGALDRDATSARGTIQALTVPLLIIALRRHRGVGIGRLRVSRSAVFHSTALLLAGVYLLAVAAIGYYVRDFGGSWGGAMQQILLGAALIALATLAVSGAMRARLRVWIGRNLFRYRYDYREEWLRFTERLSACSLPDEMGKQVVRALADMVESPAGALWTRDALDGHYAQTARWNAPASADREPTGSAFSDWLRHEGRVVDLAAEPQGADGPVPLPGWLRPQPGATGWWLVVPLVVADELIGFVVLCHARTAVEIDWEVSDLLRTASRQSASHLLQMRLTEELLETRKFESFNRMSAFVVHDLKNIVTQLGLMMRNATRHRNNPEFQKDMLATVENSLEKMRQLMLQLREGEAGAGGQAGVALLPLVRRIEAVIAARGRCIEVRADEPVVTRGHEERIERVVGHVIQNAIDATPAAGRVWVTISRHGDEARLEVGDTGCGMPSDYVRTRLFKPFQTTKATGMGLGAYESFLYVRELGGSITVDSEPGRGTVMRIALPLLRESTASRLQVHSLDER